MTSDYAISQIEALIASGLNPTPADIIRINAFGLAIDAAAGRNVSESIYNLPRVAVLKRGVFLRQPTIGHEIWIKSVLRFVDQTDLLTLLAVNCYALSRQQRDLPDPDDPENVKTAIDVFCGTMGDFTREQLYTAYDWVKFGFNPGALEDKAKLETQPEKSDDPSGFDHASCIAVGSLYNGAAVLWGLSLSEIRGMTEAQLRMTIRLASVHQHVKLDDGVEEAEGEFQDVLFEIRTRLEKEKAARSPST